MSNETIRTIQEWAIDTFGVPEPFVAYAKLCEEVGELSVALRREPSENIAEEIADVIVCAIHIGSSGLCIQDIQRAVDRKMSINRGRKWEVREDGTADHIIGGTD
jgi:NTP pyrophosphatase (non-canonical NTP hydrolase)